jgi:RNA polymerase sigma-70 factor (ECF subfamily)
MASVEVTLMKCPGLSCRRNLIRWAGSQLEDQADAEDLAGEICLHCMRGRERFRGDAEFSTWLRRIALNLLSDFVRTKRARATVSIDRLDETEIPISSSVGSSGSDAWAESEILREAMARLSPRHRHLIEWKYGDGLSYEEIADRLNTTPSAVSQALRRARLTLRRVLASSSESGLQSS